MGNGNQIGPKDADQALRLIAEGKTLSETATIIGRSTNGLHKALKESWPDEYLEAKQRRDDMIRNRIWDIGMEPFITTKDGGHAEIADTQSMRWALDHLIKWHLPEARETHRVELGGTVQIAHEARLTLANLLTAAGHVEGLSTSPQRQLPAAPLLAEPDEGEPAASDLPLRPAP